MKKILISTMLVVAGLGITGTAFAGNPVVQGPCLVNGPVPGQGDDDFAPCVGPGGVVYPARVASAPPVPPPVVIPKEIPDPKTPCVCPGPVRPSEVPEPMTLISGLVGLGVLAAAAAKRKLGKSASNDDSQPK